MIQTKLKLNDWTKFNVGFTLLSFIRKFVKKCFFLLFIWSHEEMSILLNEFP